MVNTTALVPHEHIVSTEFEDGEGVLVDLNSKHYYQLNETAMLVWRGLEDGQPLPDIINKMTTIYNVSAEQATASVEKIILDFQSRNLVQQSN
jgi:hypothetical protein